MNIFGRTAAFGVALSCVGCSLLADPDNRAAKTNRGAQPTPAPSETATPPGAPTTSGLADAAADEGSMTRPEFAFQWCVTGQAEPEVNLTGLPIERNAVIFYDQNFGLTPYVWQEQHHINGSVPQRTNLAAHVQKLKADILKAIPDPNWDGYAIIDYEGFKPAWELLESDVMREESRRIARSSRATMSAADVESTAAQEFNAAALNFMLTTIETCKAERPRAKWGFYGYPIWKTREHLEQIQPMLDASTALYPSIYARYYSVADSQVPGREQIRLAQRTREIRQYIEETRELAPGRPIVPFIWVRYHNVNPVYGMQFVTPLDLRTMIWMPWQLGCDGAIFWDHVDDSTYARKTTEYFRGRVAKELRKIHREIAKGPPSQVNDRTYVNNLTRKVTTAAPDSDR